MRVYTTLIRRLVSTRKFYDIVREKKDRLIPKTAEEAIISKYLKENATFMRSTAPAEDKNDKKNSKAISYQQFIRENPYGSMIERDHKGTQLHMLSLNYQNISLAEIYAICQKIAPSLILVQARPEAYLQHFQLLPKVSNAFSDIKYLEQLCLGPKAVKTDILTPALTQKLEEIVGGSSSISDRKVLIQDNKDIVEDDVVMMAGYYSSTNKSTLLLGELPEQPWREWLCNSHTLMELQEIFKHICKNIPFYESLQLTPYRLATLLRPELFLNVRDRYMATLIEMAIATRKYPSILCILGVTENQAIEQLLVSESLLNTKEGVFTPVIEYLVGPEIKHSLLRNIEGWEIIEKHIIADVLQHGEAVLTQPLETFTTTNKIIDHYGVLLNDYTQQTIMQFRFDKTMQYVKLMRAQASEGAELKRKFMLREALRS